VPTAHSGQRAIRLLDTGPNVRDGRYAIGVQQEAPVVPGRFYLASVWAKAQARNHEQAVLLQITFLGGTQERSFNTYITAPIGGNWKRYSVGPWRLPTLKQHVCIFIQCIFGQATRSLMMLPSRKFPPFLLWRKLYMYGARSR